MTFLSKPNYKMFLAFCFSWTLGKPLTQLSGWLSNKPCRSLIFGNSLKRWVQTFYCKAESSILNNGLSTKQIPLSRGVRQGCPLSPYLSILVAEILASKIRCDKTVQGIKLLKKEIKLSQFADDTSLICKKSNEHWKCA